MEELKKNEQLKVLEAEEKDQQEKKEAKKMVAEQRRLARYRLRYKGGGQLCSLMATSAHLQHTGAFFKIEVWFFVCRTLIPLEIRKNWFQPPLEASAPLSPTRKGKFVISDLFIKGFCSNSKYKLF